MCNNKHMQHFALYMEHDAINLYKFRYDAFQ